MQKKQKTNLFRFVTLRAPQLISADRRALGFVEHPNPSGSHFLNAITGITDIDVARTALGSQIGTFTEFETVDEIKAVSTTLWEFSLWLLKSKNNLVRSELDILIPAVPSAPEIITLWDNIFYDILMTKNAPIRQGCLQMIVAINFINKYVSYSPGISTDKEVIAEEAKLLKRLANGKVIVDKAFTIKKTIGQSLPIGLASKSYVSLEASHKGNMASLDIAPLQAMRNEFCSLSKSYKTDRDAAYSSQFSQYSVGADAALDQYIQQNNLQGQVITEDLIPDHVIEDFVFSFDDVLSASYTAGKLSAEALAYLANNCVGSSNIQNVFDRIDSDLKNNEESFVSNKSGKSRSLLINGVLTKTGNGSTKGFSISLKEVGGSQQNNYDVYLTLETGYNGGYFKTPDFKMDVNGTSHSHTDLDIISNEKGAIFAKISFGTLSNISKNEEFEFTGGFDLSNGKSMALTRAGIGGMKLYSGSGLFVSNNNSSTELYGVNRIGVADYRRVEQELCCYIAGEVSHIENILAKEYKEKATRQLTRTETSIVSTTERETEELTDTTSTTRHEMSSEVAEVLNRDRSMNFGFSVGVDGQYGKQIKWRTNANADFAFGHSTSNSNSEARTFAEDVTQRALERIVQKSSLTRTSKVLREFEENNKHGFDNREGENHVTGVYRWIDKVYKNQIVNYGKRLMYEFMVPEPAKFYKEAMITKAEEEDITAGSGNSEATTIVAPTHPREEGIIDASSVTRAKYKSQCALYGVTPIPPIEEKKTISLDYAAATGKGDKPHAYSYVDRQITLPNAELYKCKRLHGFVSGSYKSTVDPRGYLKVNAGVQLLDVGGLKKKSGFTWPLKTEVVNLEPPILVTVNTLKII